MNLFIQRHRRRSNPGAMPGTITVQPHAQAPQLDMITFGPEAPKGSITHNSLDSLDAMPPLPEHHDFLWLNVTGLGDAETLRAVGKRFELHPLVLEDIANTSQRPKEEDYESCSFIVIRVPDVASSTDEAVDGWSGKLWTRQIALCVGRDFVLTFQEQDEAALAPVRQRLLQQQGKLYQRGPDYLAYALLDAVIDTFFPVLEQYVDRVEELEASVMDIDPQKGISTVHAIKRELLALRRIFWPQRDMVSQLLRSESAFINESTHLYLRDCYDHSVQLLDLVETCRETTTSLVDILLASQSNKMNEVMKMLTIIATIFIPLSWIAGVYGMNFDPERSPWNMPELAWEYGYFTALFLMFAIAGGLLWWFWRKGWIGSKE